MVVRVTVVEFKDKQATGCLLKNDFFIKLPKLTNHKSATSKVMLENHADYTFK